MSSNHMEAQRRRQLAEDYLFKHPVKFGQQGGVKEQIVRAFMYGYDQCAIDLLSPKDTPGVPATAVTLLNRIGEMVLKTRAELLKTPVPRLQCPGCFCLLEEEHKEFGWCLNCGPHQEELKLQVAHLLQPSGEEGKL